MRLRDDADYRDAKVAGFVFICNLKVLAAVVDLLESGLYTFQRTIATR